MESSKKMEETIKAVKQLKSKQQPGQQQIVIKRWQNTLDGKCLV